jgi:hypothetical protein
VDYYRGVKIQRYHNGVWQSVAEYTRESDPGRFTMEPNVMYRVVSLWVKGSKFYSAKYPQGIYTDIISEVIEQGVFSYTDQEPTGVDPITIDDVVVTNFIDVKMTAGTTGSFDVYLPTLLVNNQSDTSYSPVPGAKMFEGTTTITDIYLPTLLTMPTQTDNMYAPVPGCLMFYDNLNVVRVQGGSLINIGG